MVFTKNLILVCSGQDTAQAAKSGLPVLHLCLAVTEQGALRRLQLPTVKTRCLLGIRDLPVELTNCSAERLAGDILYEAERAESTGVFADFERDSPICRSILSAMDKAFHGAGLPLYVPLSCAQSVQHAILTVPTAISGGSLVSHISSLQARHGASRVAALLEPVSRDFTMPSDSPDGAALSTADRVELLAKTQAQTFFSRELCAKYFTYTDEQSRAHFVLFDDASTLQAKLAQLSGCSVRTVFALYPDAAPLLTEL